MPNRPNAKPPKVVDKLVDRRHVFYGHLVEGRITRKGDTFTSSRVILKLKTGQLSKDVLFELKNAATPVCFVVSFFLPDSKRTSL